MRFVFFVIMLPILSGLTYLALYSAFAQLLLGAFLVVFLLGLYDVTQTKKTIRRNFPVIGHFRYLLEMVRPEIQQYFIESDTDGKPIPRVYRSLIYQRAKGDPETVPFGTQLNVYGPDYEWIPHSLYPTKVSDDVMRVKIGGPQCSQPYNASLLNISAMSYGALSPTAIQSLNKGAKLGGFYHNTGEGGLSPHHLNGGDLVWQIGTGYFGCRDENGNFDPILFKKKAELEVVKMIEIKLSQGAKPGHGGILPGSKVTEEISQIRHVPVGKTVYSPSRHSAFKDNEGLLHFAKKLRDLSGGKPVGIKLCVGKHEDFHDICKAMVSTGILLDFITIDGGEGGTGAAPLELTNNVGSPLEDGLSFVDNTLRGYNLRNDIRIIASGKVLTGFHVFKRLALGADLVNSARAMMLALGCIQALRCNTNHCPAGVATTLPKFYKGLDVKDKSVRVYQFQNKTLHAFKELLECAGLDHPSQVNRSSVYLRGKGREVLTLDSVFPSVREGEYL
jgi:glutamate synthase domain-containing protein 2